MYCLRFLEKCFGNRLYFSWFQTFLCSECCMPSSGLIHRCLNFVCRHFGTLYLFQRHRHIWRWDRVLRNVGIKIQKPRNYAEESIQHVILSPSGEILGFKNVQWLNSAKFKRGSAGSVHRKINSFPWMLKIILNSPRIEQTLGPTESCFSTDTTPKL